MHVHRHSYSISGRKSRLLSAAKLISHSRTGLPSTHLYEMALDCYGLLMDALEDPGVAREISAFAHVPANEIPAAADAIIDRLLFNRENNPYISLGLKENVSVAEAARRWKRLIILYHPDRYPNQAKYEERAKKINQAYAELNRMRGKAVRYEVIKNVRRTSSYPNSKMLYSKYMRRLPAVILTIAVIMAILAVLLLVIRSKKSFTLHMLTERQTIVSIAPAANHPSIVHFLAYRSGSLNSGGGPLFVRDRTSVSAHRQSLQREKTLALI